MELILGLMFFGKISLLPLALVIDASIVFGTKGLESKKEEYLSSFVHSLLVFELNSVSYEEILLFMKFVLGSIVPVDDGMIAEEEGFSVSPLTFDEGTKSSAYSFPIQSVEG
jgi:hypothetical protein